MPKYKPIRAIRYEHLRASGFLNKEAMILSKVPQNIPYVREMMSDRRFILKKAEREGYTPKDYQLEIEKLYSDNNWSNYGIIAGKRLLKLDASAIYKMLREYEERWKNEHDEFRSPWVKRQKRNRNFENLFEKSFQQFRD